MYQKNSRSVLEKKSKRGFEDESWEEKGFAVNIGFPNAPVGYSVGLIGSFVCLCQAAMPTL